MNQTLLNRGRIKGLLSLFNGVGLVGAVFILSACGGSDKPSVPTGSISPSPVATVVASPSPQASVLPSPSPSPSPSPLVSSSPSASGAPVAVQPDLNCSALECENNNKQIVEQVYEHVINGHFTELLDDIFAVNVIDRSPVANGLQAQRDAYELLLLDNPDKTATIKHIVADGDYVAVHWHYSTAPSDEKTGNAYVDLYRLDNGLVVERWSVSQNSSGETESRNSMFSDLYDYGSNLANSDIEIEEQNKIFVVEFYENTFNNHDLELFDASISLDYIQHNRGIGNGSAELRGWIADGRTGGIDVFLALAEGDIVWTFRRQPNGSLLVADLWRVDNNINRIVEHWDVF
ncbi:ester cyclase [Agaribacterium sp. ZY112]|uniref:nuclear transport factor 2 family protein n=1 Tax=Agaribacterium sp. ZY112 TaxID=3233574 RepID=UPI00352461B2